MSELDPLFRALADPTRRQILELLRRGPRTTGELAGAFPSSRFAVMKHLGVLVEAGVVVPERDGRERWNRLEPGPLRHLVDGWAGAFLGGEGGNVAKKEGKADKEKPPKVKGKCRAIDVTLTVPIAAPRAQVWKALTAGIASWWPSDFYVGKSPKGFVLEPFPGGRLFEDWGEGAGVLWGHVVTFDPPATLDVAGSLFPSFGGPATTMVRWALAEENGSTLLTLTDSVFGRVNEKTSVSLLEGWRLLTGALKVAVEPPPPKKARTPRTTRGKTKPAAPAGDAG